LAKKAHEALQCPVLSDADKQAMVALNCQSLTEDLERAAKAVRGELAAVQSWTPSNGQEKYDTLAKTLQALEVQCSTFDAMYASQSDIVSEARKAAKGKANKERYAVTRIVTRLRESGCMPKLAAKAASFIRQVEVSGETPTAATDETTAPEHSKLGVGFVLDGEEVEVDQVCTWVQNAGSVKAFSDFVKLHIQKLDEKAADMCTKMTRDRKCAGEH
jgi:hypothetical protein